MKIPPWSPRGEEAERQVVISSWRCSGSLMSSKVRLSGDATPVWTEGRYKKETQSTPVLLEEGPGAGDEVGGCEPEDQEEEFVL